MKIRYRGMIVKSPYQGGRELRRHIEAEQMQMRQLVTLRKYGGQITSSPETNITTLHNVLPYYFVEITSRGGTK